MVSAAHGLNDFSLLRWIPSLQELGDIDQLRRAAVSFNFIDDQGNVASEIIDELKIRYNKITLEPNDIKLMVDIKMLNISIEMWLRNILVLHIKTLQSLKTIDLFSYQSTRAWEIFLPLKSSN